MLNANVFRNLSYGLYVLSTQDKEKGRPTGCTINSVMQITSEPLTVGISVNKSNYTNSRIKDSGVFALSILSEETEPSIIGNFGFQSGRDAAKFENIDAEIVEGIPVLKDCCGYIVCKVIDQMEASTHTIFLGEVIACDVVGTNPPMTYAYYHAVVKNKTSKPSAPEKKSVQAGPAYVCNVCGYTYDGEEPFETLPDDYVCPVCGVTKEHFEVA